jgi:hypothetical protein
MLGRKQWDQLELFLTGSLRQLVPNDHVLARIDRVLDLSWLREEVGACYCVDDGRPGIDPEVAVRLMLAGLLGGIVHVPIAPSSDSPCAYRCVQSRAERARRSELGSSPPPSLRVHQRRDHRRRCRGIDRARYPHPRPARKLDLDDAARGRQRGQRRQGNSRLRPAAIVTAENVGALSPPPCTERHSS